MRRRLCDSGGTNKICTEEPDHCLLHQQNTKLANWRHSGQGEAVEVGWKRPGVLAEFLLFPVYTLKATPWKPIASSTSVPCFSNTWQRLGAIPNSQTNKKSSYVCVEPYRNYQMRGCGFKWTLSIRVYWVVLDHGKHQRGKAPLSQL